ncbi:YkvA family protein [Bacillota bacterium Lsc_1132]
MKKTLANLKTKAKKLKQDLFVLGEAYKHPATPLYVKILAIIIVAYAFSPIDLIPDFIPVLGYLDDLILLPLGIMLALKLIPKDVLADCRKKVENSEKEKKKNWVAGAIILLLWTGIIFWLVVLILNKTT